MEPNGRFRPSATAVLVALITLTAAVFVRCGGGTPEPVAPVASSVTPAPAKEAPVVAVTDASVDPAEAAANQAPPPKQRYVVAAIGDSITDERSHGGKYLAYVKERCPESQFDNYGKGGDMVNQMRRRFPREVLGEFGGPKPHYTHLVVFGGVNDLYSDLTAGRNPKNVSEDLAWMYQRGREKGMQIVAITVAPWGGFKKYYNEKRGKATIELNDWIKSQLSAKTVDYVIDAYSLLSCGDPERLCADYEMKFLQDGLHFSAPGHERLGAALYEQVFANCL
jgi:lysophospholipase L1-like esterase